MTFTTIPVTGDGLKAGPRGHIILTDDGTIATIDRVDIEARGGRTVHWAQLDNPIDAEPKTGIIHLPDGATVECVRVGDWANRQDSEAAR